MSFRRNIWLLALFPFLKGAGKITVLMSALPLLSILWVDEVERSKVIQLGLAMLVIGVVAFSIGYFSGHFLEKADEK